MIIWAVNGISKAYIVTKSLNSSPLLINMAQDKKKSLTIWSYVKPFYWMMRYFGVGPFSIVGDVQNRRIRTRPCDVLLLLIALSIQIYILYLNVTVDLSLSRTSTFLIDKGAHLIEIFKAFNVVSGTCSFAFCGKKVWKIFCRCSEIDSEVCCIAQCFMMAT